MHAVVTARAVHVQLVSSPELSYHVQMPALFGFLFQGVKGHSEIALQVSSSFTSSS
jgi:hypothetical protein